MGKRTKDALWEAAMTGYWEAGGKVTGKPLRPDSKVSEALIGEAVDRIGGDLGTGRRWTTDDTVAMVWGVVGLAILIGLVVFS